MRSRHRIRRLPPSAWIALIAVWGLFSTVEVVAADRPNILLIYTDDQSFRTLSCYRDVGAWPWVKTPAIDRLASEGVQRFVGMAATRCASQRSCGSRLARKR